MQFIVNKLGYKFSTKAGEADAYSPFAKVIVLLNKVH